MSATLRKLLISLPVSLLFAGSCFAQLTAIEGDVKGPDGKGIKDAVVKIDRKDMKGNYKTKSDKKGHYYYGGLPIGQYMVTLEIGGKDVDQQGVQRTSSSDSVVVNFDMKEIAARQAKANASAS